MKRKHGLYSSWPLPILVTLLGVMSLAACTQDDTQEPWYNGSNGSGGYSGTDEDSDSQVDVAIDAYDGELADDAAADVVGTDEDIYWEANEFTNTVNIVYDEASASVTTSSEEILCYVTGAHVTVDMQTNSVKNVGIVISGKSSDGSLKIYGEKKFKLTLDGVDLTSASGPAINSQCKKRIFVHLAEGTTNRLTDAATYADDSYYLGDATADSEDRKGCFFSEGNLVFSGAS